MFNLADILKERIAKYNSLGKNAFKDESKEYNKTWANAVNHFKLRINKDRNKEGLTDLSFIVVRQKLLALKEIDDLRWFYFHCLKYSGTKDKNGKKNTFSKAFFGALKIK